MKKFALIIGLLLCILSTIQAKDRVIKRPPFISWSSNVIEFDRIVINDTATIAYIKAYYHPNYWIKIAKGSFLKDPNGQIYPIRTGIGITLDKEFWMPDSSEAEFQLVFPPLPANVNSVDFLEDDSKNPSGVWGIQLDSKAYPKFVLPKGIKAPKVDKKMTLPEPINKYGKAILKGRILDYKKEMFTTGSIYLSDVLRGLMIEDKISIEEDGTFYKEIDAFTVTSVSIDLHQQEMIKCLLAPGDTTDITINLREIARQQSKLHSTSKPCGKKIYFRGYLASLQQELSDYKFDFTFYNEMYEQRMKSIYGKTPEEYKAYMLNKMPEFRKQVANSKRSLAWKEIQNCNIDFSASTIIIQTERDLKVSHIMKHKLERKESDKYFYEAKLDFPQNYYQCLKELPSLNSSIICYTHALPFFLDLMARILNTEEMVKEGLGTDKGYLFDNIKASQIAGKIKDLCPLTSEQKKQLNQLPESYGKMLEVMNNDLLEKLELNKKKNGFTINEVGQVANENLFSSIISKYHGHTLLVDFWATWCGPCQRANKEIMPMKEDLKDKDIIYIYLTDESSPMETWQNMIPDLHGEHFRFTKEQWSYLRDHFKIKGVPTYFVIDKNGNLTFRETGFPGIDIMKKELMNALDQQSE